MIFRNDIRIFDEKRKMKAMRKSLRMTTNTFKKSQFIPAMGSIRLFLEPNQTEKIQNVPYRTEPKELKPYRTEPKKTQTQPIEFFSKVRTDLISGLFVISFRYDRK